MDLIDMAPKSHPSKWVGLILEPNDPYDRGVLRGIANFVRAHNSWECFFIPPEEAIRPLNGAGERLRGVIGKVTSVRVAEGFAGHGVPAINVGPTNHVGLPWVATDETAVGRIAADYLISHGLVNFAFFGVASNGSASQQRESGFCETLQAAGFNPYKSLVISDPRHTDPLLAPNGNRLEQWLRRVPKPVGILAASDLLAYQVTAACRVLNIRVPGQVTVLGVDNDEVLCDLANPPLTSIAPATQRIGYEAAVMLERSMRGHPVPYMEMLIPPVGVVPRLTSELPEFDDPDVQSAVRYIRLHANEGLRVDDVLHEVKISRRSLETRFVRTLGRTPAQEIRRVQVALAKRLLAETNDQMPAVALAAGFTDAKQFSDSFRREAGLTPTAYRRLYRPKAARE